MITCSDYIINCSFERNYYNIYIILLFHSHSKGLVKRTQHFTQHSCNIVASNVVLNVAFVWHGCCTTIQHHATCSKCCTVVATNNCIS